MEVVGGGGVRMGLLCTDAGRVVGTGRGLDTDASGGTEAGFDDDDVTGIGDIAVDGGRPGWSIEGG